MIGMDLLLFACFAIASFVFHEQGHKIVAGDYWIGYRFKLPYAVFCEVRAKEMRVNHYMGYVLAGFIFSCPLIVLSFFVLPGFLVAGLILFNLLASGVDFYTFFRNLLVIFLHRVDLKTKIGNLK